MTDQEYNDTIAKIKTALDRWVSPLGLKWWRDITMEYFRDPASMKRAVEGDWSDEFIAYTYTDWEYCQAVVKWNVQKVFEASTDEIDYHVRHELAHILVREMREWGDVNSNNKIAHEERVCTMLAMAFAWIWEAATEAANAPLAQRAEQPAHNREVAGSIPAGGTTSS